MAEDYNYVLVERGIGHQYHNRRLLQKALTAAGVEVDGQNGHDGNKRLAAIGQQVGRLAIEHSGLHNNLSQDRITEAHTLFDSKDHLAARADRFGITGCIKLCPASPEPSTHVVRLAMRAIIGAAWEDTRSLEVVGGIIQRFIPSVDFSGTSLVLLSPPLDQAVSSPDDIEHILSLPSPSLALSNFGDGPAIPSDVQFAEAAGDKPVSMTEQGHVQTHFDLDRILEELTQQTFERNGSDWDLTTITSDTTLATVDGSSQAVPSCSSMNETMTTCPKRPRDGNNDSSPDPNVNDVSHSAKRPRIGFQSSNEDKKFKHYVDIEDRRCADHKLPTARESYLTQATLNETFSIGNRSGRLFTRLLVGMCSPSSIVALHATLRSTRGLDAPLQSPAASLSVPERFHTITAAENQITGLIVLKRCHILKLWEDQSARCPLQDGWISVHSGPERIPKKPGNPLNHRISLATDDLVGCIFPGVKKTSDDYDTKRSKVQKLLHMGQKLSMLENEFGLGILGLIQCHESDALKADFPNISDHELSSVSVTDFKKFLPILSRSQGPLLRRFSSAATLMVQHIMEGSVDASWGFPLESVATEYIMSLPKGSPRLLAILSNAVPKEL